MAHPYQTQPRPPSLDIGFPSQMDTNHEGVSGSDPDHPFYFTLPSLISAILILTL